MKELRCLCRQTYSRHCAGMLDSQLETGFSQIPRRRLHPTALPPILHSFHSAPRRPTIRPHTRPYGFYHLSIELSLVKAFNTWGFGTHSKYLPATLIHSPSSRTGCLFFPLREVQQGDFKRQGLHSVCFCTYGHGWHQVSPSLFVCKPPWATAPT